MLVKCKCHGIKINRDSAFKLTINKKNEYYCSEEDWTKIQEEKDSRKKLFNTINNIFGYAVTNTILNKEISELSQVYTYTKVSSYTYENAEFLSKVMGKSFNSEFGKIKYFTAILKNNLKDYKLPTPEITKQSNTEIIDFKYKPKERKKSIEEYISEME